MIMMRQQWSRHQTMYYHILGLGVVGLVLAALQAGVSASPFGQGVFGANVPFGSATSLSIALSGNVMLNLTPSGAVYTGSGSHTVTVTSTDVVGYGLYVHTLGSPNMVNGSVSIPPSANVSAAPLSVNTWGYNSNGSGNFLGMSSGSTLLKSGSGPFETGDPTTVTYGAKTDITQAAGSYHVSVVYTAVALNP